MNALLVTLNSKFTHTSLALRCLRQAAPRGTEILECTVNQPKDEILRQILSPAHSFYHEHNFLKLVKFGARRNNFPTAVLHNVEITFINV